MTFTEYYKQWLKENPKWEISDYTSRLVKKIRIEAGLTQYELAKLMNTKQESIARAERKDPKHTASLAFLERLAKATGRKLKMPDIE